MRARCRRICNFFKSYEDEKITEAKNSISEEIRSGRFGSETNTIFGFGIELLNKMSYIKTSQEQLEFDLILVGTAIVAMAREDAKYGPQLQYGKKYLYPIRLSELKKMCDIEIKPSDHSSEWYEQYSIKGKELIQKVGHKALIEKDLPFEKIIKKEVLPFFGPLVNEIGERHESLLRNTIDSSINMPTVLNQLVGDYLFGQSLIVG